MTQYVSVAQIRSDVFFIMLHHASKFEITILFHTSLVEDIIKQRSAGQDMCTVTDTSSCIHSLRQHRVIRMVGNFFSPTCIGHHMLLVS